MINTKQSEKRSPLRLAALTAALSTTLFALATGSASAGGDVERGKSESQVCASCHGPDGNGDNPLYPRIAGQHESYLIQALQQYREGSAPTAQNTGGLVAKKLSRNNAIMAGFAGQLTDQQIADLAAYYASQKGALYTPTNWDD